MKLVSHLQTNTMRFFASKGGSVFVPDLVRGLHERYRFWQSPQSMQEYTAQAGAEFQTGAFSGTTIDLFRIHGNGVFVEGRTSTEVLDAFIDDALAWISKNFDVQFEAAAPVGRAYTSSIEIQCSVGVEAYLKGLSEVSAKLTDLLSRYGLDIEPYEFNAVIATTDATKSRPVQPGRFVFDRRANQPFSSGMYYSEAPLSTPEHLQLVEMLESIWMAA